MPSIMLQRHYTLAHATIACFSLAVNSSVLQFIQFTHIHMKLRWSEPFTITIQTNIVSEDGLYPSQCKI